MLRSQGAPYGEPLLSGDDGCWKTLDWQRALSTGQASVGLPYSGQFDFVGPIYARYKYDGTITNNIVYNLCQYGMGDVWEWADLPGFPAGFSTYAYQVGINAIIYSMSH